jgi:hypothetical protein
MIYETSILDQCISLSELERVLPSSTYNRIVKNFLTDKGYTNITKFARQNGYSKQFISKVINNDVKDTLQFSIEVIKEGRTTFVKRV